MEEQGHVRWKRDEQGNVIGIILQLSGSANIKIGASGNLTKKPKEDESPNQ